METLALEISKILNITIEKAIELMPIIRSQFIRYNIISSITGIFWWVGAIASTIVLVTAMIYFIGVGYDEDTSESKKYLILSLKVVALSSVSIALGNIMIYTLAPDFMILKEFILK